MDAHSDRRARANEVAKRVERGILERFGLRFERRGEIFVAATSDLGDDVVNPTGRRIRHEVIDRTRRGDLVADDPERFFNALAAKCCVRRVDRVGARLERDRASPGGQPAPCASLKKPL